MSVALLASDASAMVKQPHASDARSSGRLVEARVHGS